WRDEYGLFPVRQFGTAGLTSADIFAGFQGGLVSERSLLDTRSRYPDIAGRLPNVPDNIVPRYHSRSHVTIEEHDQQKRATKGEQERDTKGSYLGKHGRLTSALEVSRSHNASTITDQNQS